MYSKYSGMAKATSWAKATLNSKKNQAHCRVTKSEGISQAGR